MQSYWDSLASQFHHQQPPLRPCAEDAAIFSRIIHDWHRKHAPLRTSVLVLGVTPEIVSLPWPANTSLLAVERSQAMIDLVWPGNIPDVREVVLGNWFDIELKPQSFDLVVGDGFLTGLAYPGQYHQIAKTVAQWLRPSGLLIARLFVRSKRKETLEQIMTDLKAGTIGRFDILKWRLGMAIQDNALQGVVVDEIHRAWSSIEKELPSLPERAGWPRPTVDTIKLYEGRADRYTFPSIAELNAAFGASLEPVSTTVPEYDFGECCPTLVYRRRWGINLEKSC